MSRVVISTFAIVGVFALNSGAAFAQQDRSLAIAEGQALRSLPQAETHSGERDGA